jgi:c-di-AMP phosphodiesterase-like protein
VIHIRCAIAKWTEPDDDVRIFSAQAADQLLEIEDVDASFVLFVCTVNDKQCINISARSYGVLNVQLIMEKLGGGGHQTMAAAQVYDNDIDTAQEMLSAAIDEYIASIS